MRRSLIDEFDCAMEEAGEVDPQAVSIATGALTYGYICELVEKAGKKWHNINCRVYRIRNDFFGETITVTGLITGQDLISQLKGKPLGNTLILCSSMIRKDGELFLDDYTVSDVESSLGVKIRLIENDGYELFDAITGN